MITELGEQYLQVQSLKTKKKNLEEEVERLEKHAELLGAEIEDSMEVDTYDGYSDQAHIFAVTVKPGDTFLTAAEGNSLDEARENLRNRIPAICKIHCHIGEINQMVGTKRNL